MSLPHLQIKVRRCVHPTDSNLSSPSLPPYLPPSLPPKGHAVFLAKSIEHLPTSHTQRGFERARRVVDACVNDLQREGGRERGRDGDTSVLPYLLHPLPPSLPPSLLPRCCVPTFGCQSFSRPPPLALPALPCVVYIEIYVQRLRVILCFPNSSPPTFYLSSYVLTCVTRKRSQCTDALMRTPSSLLDLPPFPSCTLFSLNSFTTFRPPTNAIFPYLANALAIAKPTTPAPQTNTSTLNEEGRVDSQRRRRL